ncbi:GIY-YIG nuclease family protein [uncultured Flavobacterium sp.]|uniref:GIY-YIG nuclease family protein n=1 Tax=uncultured Flavobacterium sp. TaxID=165435 RepID=UPI002595B51C|nr:GIY-YIG nuclease family protein [uncultured Flavobacterium sp.]
MKGYMYILLCANGSYYTGSTVDLERRLEQHQAGEGANHTKKHLPIELVYYEEYDRIDLAFNREKQVQGWSRKKKEALIENREKDLPLLSRNYSQYGAFSGDVASTSSATEKTSSATETN